MPYGVYDLAANSGWVSVGVDHDTAAPCSLPGASFAVNSIRQWWRNLGRVRYPNATRLNSIRQWWRNLGRVRYPNATRLLITATPAPAKAGGGGSNGSRVRLWKRELQKLANKLGLDIVISHPGRRRGRLCRLAPASGTRSSTFSFISQNWRAQPLVSYRVIVELISATTTKTGLTVRCELDTANTPKALSFLTPRWPPLTSNAPNSTASGTTPSHRIPTRQIARLFRDEP